MCWLRTKADEPAVMVSTISKKTDISSVQANELLLKYLTSTLLMVIKARVTKMATETQSSSFSEIFTGGSLMMGSMGWGVSAGVV